MNLGANTFAGHCRGITWVCVKIWAFWHSSRLGAKLAMTCSSVPIIWTISWSLSTPMPCRERMQTKQENKMGERYALKNDLKIYIFTFWQKRKDLVHLNNIWNKEPKAKLWEVNFESGVCDICLWKCEAVGTGPLEPTADTRRRGGGRSRTG